VPEAKEIAVKGIVRHIKCCDKIKVDYDRSAVAEIIKDAQVGRAVWQETDEEFWQKELASDRQDIGQEEERDEATAERSVCGAA